MSAATASERKGAGTTPAPRAQFTKTPRGWRVRVFGSSENLSGQKVLVARRDRDPKSFRLGRLVAPDEGNGAYYEVAS